MLLKAKSGSVSIQDTDMDYISFGRGDDILIMLPGLGDGLTTVKGKALFLAMIYRCYAKDFQVFIFSRKNQLHQGYSTRNMARDQATAMNTLGITKANVLGISQGGMIAQYLAIDYPDLVKQLVLGVTSSRTNNSIQEIVKRWMTMAEKGDYKGLVTDTLKQTYSEKYLKKYRLLYPILGKIGKPKSFQRFLVQAASCIDHNAYNELDKIVCPTLVLGGNEDKIVGANSSIELAERINNCELYNYHGLGHGAYEEAKDFHDRVVSFLKG